MKFLLRIAVLLVLVQLTFSSCEVKGDIPTLDLKTVFEENSNTSATYEEGIAFYDKLDGRFTKCKLLKVGETDSGNPLHLAVLSGDKKFSLTQLANSEKPLLFINNAIHPGEPCGVDATMMLFRDILSKDSLQNLLDKVNIVAIPYYNVSGAQNRNSTTRTNQNGPEEHGFRGNIKNLDLNRDFIKADSKNARSFSETFSALQPAVFLDNHTSNGADYQYTMTLINTVPERLPPVMKTMLKDELLPALYGDMENRGWPMSPYVFTTSGIPDGGIMQFNDTPRYSNGYATLHHSFAFTGETHMLKPFEDRVWSNYELMMSIITWMSENADELQKVRQEGMEFTRSSESMAIQHELDTSVNKSLLFKGYTAAYKPSEIHGKDRLYYDRSQPWEREITFYDTFKSTLEKSKPQAYYIPQAWSKVIDRLRWNDVELVELDKDFDVTGEIYFIEAYDTRSQPYEGHYLHSNVKVRTEQGVTRYKKGDFKVVMGTKNDHFVMATLEPEAPDSYFAWNFFDGIVQQKEYFSPYVFEDEAVELLKQHPEWQKELDQLKNEDEAFRNNARAQLNWIYQKSDHYEPSHNRYPIVRGNEEKAVAVNYYSE